MKQNDKSIEKPQLPQSVAYKRLKKNIIDSINQSGIPVWALTDMLENVLRDLKNFADQITENDSVSYKTELANYQAQNQKMKEENGEEKVDQLE